MASLEGQQLGKYRVLEPLGRGGMARVYRAYHAKLDRYVAIKVMRSDLVDDADFLARFSREARAIASLRHGNIVQVYDFDMHDETYYMVMELLEGDTLKTRLNDYRLRSEKMPYGEAIRLLLDVLDGLGYAHEEGMIHRDIKPANILLTKKGEAVLADFGIAQIVGGTRHTMSGALMGTLSYMAPEVVNGKFDARSDLYAVGIVFFEMLTHTTPFDGDTPLAVLMKHINDPLPLPREFDPSIPDAFERILLKSLEKDPDSRYQNAAEMASALRQAARQLDLDIPSSISLPLSFTTAEAPAESVAVFSGTVRQQLIDEQFADDDTAGVTEIEQLKEKEKAQVKEKVISDEVLPFSGKDPQSYRPKQKPDKARRFFDTLSPKRQTMFGVATIIGANFLAIILTGFTGGSVWANGWPFEIFAVATLLFATMYVQRNAWTLIPAGIVLGNGFIFGYYATTGFWHQWAYLWPLEPILVFTAIFGTRYWIDTVQPNSHRVRELAFHFGRIGFISTIVAILVGAIGSPF